MVQQQRAVHGSALGSGDSLAPPADLLSATDWHDFGRPAGVGCSGHSGEVRFFAQADERTARYLKVTPVDAQMLHDRGRVFVEWLDEGEG